MFDFPGLEAAIMETQKVLRSAVEQSNGDAPSSLSSEGDMLNARQRLEHLVSKGEYGEKVNNTTQF